MAPPEKPQAPEGKKPETSSTEALTQKKVQSMTAEQIKDLKENVSLQALKDELEAWFTAAVDGGGKLPDNFFKNRCEVLPKEHWDLVSQALETKEQSKEKPKETTPSAAEKIYISVSAYVDKMGVGDKLNAFAKKIGFKEGIGDQANFVKNFFIGMAAKMVESVAFMLKGLSANPDKTFRTALDLRLRNLGLVKTEEKDIYAEAYMKLARRAKKAADFNPPGSYEEADEFLKNEKVAQDKAEKKAQAEQAAKDTADALQAGTATAKASEKPNESANK